jgi:ABC-2 type transport system permease protein
VNSLRLFFVGGMTSYRALFYWLSPTIYIPSLIVAPIFQILLFAYIGRSAGLESDLFYVTGNAIQYASIPCLFAMSQLVSGERYQNTLFAILVSPARRLPLFVGRALPVMGNAAFVSAVSFAAGCLILGVSIPAEAIPGLAAVILVAAFSCTGLGLINAAISLRVRENAVLSNVIFGFLLIFTGANVPISELPGWMQDVSHALPLTHAIEAARELATGAPFSSVTDLLATELGIGVAYLAVGLALLRVFEWQGRKHATLEQL